jgi:hypothetical protein
VGTKSHQYVTSEIPTKMLWMAGIGLMVKRREVRRAPSAPD